MNKRILLTCLLLLCSTPIWAATYTDTNCADSGVGSLRQALTDASSDGYIVEFNIPSTVADSTGEVYAGKVTQGADIWYRIIISSSLPSIESNNIKVQGSSQTSNQGDSNSLGPEIEIRANATFDAIAITGNYATLEGLVINRVISNDGNGIYLNGSDYSHIYGCYVGTSASGEAAPNTNDFGIYIINDANYNQIGDGTAAGRNIISGNSRSGIDIYGSNSNEVTGNYIGVRRDGSSSLGNAWHGIAIHVGSKYNKIGNGTPGGRNTISSNFSNGIYIRDTGSDSNEVFGNFIGTQVNGISPLPNGNGGINIYFNPQFNRIGSSEGSKGNIISCHSGSGDSGIRIDYASNNFIEGNWIGLGTDESIATNESGILITANSQSNQIISNVVSGNTYGIVITGEGTASNEVLGNYIGTDSTATADRGNFIYGIYITGSAQNNKIGNATANGRNIISGNDNRGLQISGTGTNSNEVLGNYIGTDVNGTLALGNTTAVYLDGGTQFNRIGDGTSNGRNILSGNSYGVYMIGTDTNSNEVLGNYIGTDVAGTAALSNESRGVTIMSGASYNLIGGNTSTPGTGAGNVISGNESHGVYISSSYNHVLGNLIGTSADGSSAIPNGTSDIINGVYIQNSNNLIGNGSTEGRNIISGNAGNGILISGASATNNEVLGNYIGTDINGTSDLGNGNAGIKIFIGSQFNKIGNGTPGGRNVICKNSYGITINSTGTNSNEVLGNYIGVDATGATALGNMSYPIEIYNGPRYNKIGSSIPGGGNVISGNPRPIYFTVTDGTDTNSNEVAGNYIGTDSTGTIDLGNSRQGILISPTNGNIQFITIGPSNTIAHNGSAIFPDGISLEGAGVNNIVITQNSIYGNYGKGIGISNGANPGTSTPLISSAIYDPALGQSQVAGESAPALGTVELFKAEGNQGKTYLGSTTANASGKWSITLSSLVIGDAVVVTGTTANPETSEFSSTEVVVEGVIPPPSDLSSFDISAPSTTIQYSPFSATITARDSAGSIETNVIGTTQLLVDQGTITPESIAETEFVNGVWSDSVTLSKIGMRTITASNEGATGTGQILVLNATIEITSGGVTITVPAGASSQEVSISVTEVTDPPGNPPPGYVIAGTMYNIVSTPTDYLLPVTVTIPISGPLADPRVYYWTGTEWSRDGISIVEVANTYITFTTAHLTIFAPMQASSNNLVRFGPNPYNPDSGTPAKIWYWLDADANTSIYVVDMAGTLVWKKSFDVTTNGGRSGSNDVDFDGKDRWGNVLGNGVYIYKIVQNGKAVGGGKIAIIK